METAFPADGNIPDVVETAEVVIDCTASQAARQAVATVTWDHPVILCSAAMGRRANRLFWYTTYSHRFRYSEYEDAFEPWRLQEQREWDETEDAIPERIGCWHPASVIRMDRVMTWAGTVTRLFDETAALTLGESEFTVLETSTTDDGTPTITQASPPFQDVITWEAPTSEVTLQVPRDCLKAMWERCRADYPDETGGIVAGTDRDDAAALVTNTTDPPRDSIQSSTRFLRGTDKVDRWLTETAETIGIAYLGEWHFHPTAPPTPSEQDCEAMQEIATDDGYDCPHPLLFIVGPDDEEGFTINAYLFHRDQAYEQLHRTSQQTPMPATTTEEDDQ